MTASWARGGAIAGPLHGLAAILFLIALMAPAAAAEPIDVHLDQATIIGLPARAKTIVIGNPLIADISLVHSKDQDLVVITGKGYGATNIIAMDGSRGRIAEEDDRGDGTERPDRRGLSRPDAADL